MKQYFADLDWENKMNVKTLKEFVYTMLLQINVETANMKVIVVEWTGTEKTHVNQKKIKHA